METMENQHDIKLNEMKTNFEQLKNQGQKELDTIKYNHNKDVLNSHKILIQKIC